MKRIIVCLLLLGSLALNLYAPPNPNVLKKLDQIGVKVNNLRVLYMAYFENEFEWMGSTVTVTANMKQRIAQRYSNLKTNIINSINSLP